ncbi:hypothetical protein FRC11_002453 [Ceratobasidium sp. 423]|nr:hypothetical protein FRC11_002453 [Ceratobasidium sp. 423]
MSSVSRTLYSRVISAFLENCIAGKLTQFSIKLATNSLTFRGSETLMEQPETTVEALWLPVTALRLRGFFPNWTSKVYQGLTELRLGGDRMAIFKSALVAILKSSPKLRVLQLGIGISDTTLAPVTPALLEDLEVLIPDAIDTGYQLSPMGLIQPGPKPLTLLIRNLSRHKVHIWFHGGDETKNFLARANVTRLILTGFVDYADLAGLLAIAPTIRALALERLSRTWVVKNESALPSPSTLDMLYVMRSINPSSAVFSTPTWPLIEQVIRRHCVPKLTIWCYPSDGVDVPDNLCTVCPQVTVIPDEDPDPIQEWK